MVGGSVDVDQAAGGMNDGIADATSGSGGGDSGVMIAVRFTTADMSAQHNTITDQSMEQYTSSKPVCVCKRRQDKRYNSLS